MKTAQRMYTLKRSRHHAAPPRSEVSSLSIVGVTDWMPSANRFQFGVRALEDQLSLGQNDELRHEALEILK